MSKLAWKNTVRGYVLHNEDGRILGEVKPCISEVGWTAVLCNGTCLRYIDEETAKKAVEISVSHTLQKF